MLAYSWHQYPRLQGGAFMLGPAHVPKDLARDHPPRDTLSLCFAGLLKLPGGGSILHDHTTRNFRAGTWLETGGFR